MEIQMGAATEAMKTRMEERAALRRWEEGGKKGPRPATPLTDALNARDAAKRASEPTPAKKAPAAKRTAGVKPTNVGKGAKKVPATTKKAAPRRQSAPVSGDRVVGDADRQAVVKSYIDKGITGKTAIAHAMRADGVPVGPWLNDALDALAKRAKATPAKKAPAARKSSARKAA